MFPLYSLYAIFILSITQHDWLPEVNEQYNHNDGCNVHPNASFDHVVNLQIIRAEYGCVWWC